MQWTSLLHGPWVVPTRIPGSKKEHSLEVVFIVSAAGPDRPHTSMKAPLGTASAQPSIASACLLHRETIGDAAWLVIGP